MNNFLKIEKGEVENVIFEIKVHPKALLEVAICDCWICKELREYCVEKGIIRSPSTGAVRQLYD